jgi:hypothetical protein
MLDLNNYSGKDLTISQKSFYKSEFHLLDKKNIIGKLYRIKMLNDLYRCEIDDKIVEFYKKNFVGNEILIKQPIKSLPFASFKSNFLFTSGELKLERGKKLLIKIGLFKDKASLYESENKLLIQLQRKLSLKSHCTITINIRSELLENYSWLPLFLFYLTEIKNSGLAFS